MKINLNSKLQKYLLKTYRIVIISLFASGITIVFSSLIAPQLPVQIISILISDPLQIANALKIHRKTLLILYGISISLLSGTVYIFSKALFHSINSPDLKRQTFRRFLVFFSFTVSFIGARSAVVLSGIVGERSSSGLAGALPINEIWFNGYHIHHFFFGFLFLVIIGWIAVFKDNYSKNLMAVLYGIGLGIFLDEIGMLLTEGQYFATSTYFFVVTFFSILLAALYWDTVKNIE